jgi:hypothetical protein
MQCPLCGARKARRACPALNKDICPVCCGTKRLTEIACPSTCGYLATSREHPAAVVRKQQERDVAALLPILQTLTERQYQLLILFHTVVVARHKPEGFARLIDDDVADAAEATAKTLETAARGVIYEHAAQTMTAQRLAVAFKGLLADLRDRGAQVHDREAASALRAMASAAREVRKAADGGDTAYLALMARLHPQSPAEAPRMTDGSSLLIQP